MYVALHHLKKKKIINWEDREKELNDLLDKHRRKDGYWDVVVPWVRKR